MTSPEETLPRGTIIQRTIRGKLRFYHQWRENGKTLSRYLKADEVLPLREKLAANAANKANSPSSKTADTSFSTAQTEARPFFNAIVTGRRLAELTAGVRRLSTRTAFATIRTYLQRSPDSSVLLVTGLPGSGKTTLLRQAILSLDPGQADRHAYVSLVSDCRACDFLSDLERLAARGVTHVFVDGLERAPMVGQVLPALEDTFAASGMKIILSSARPVPTSTRTQVVSTTFLSYQDAVATSDADSLIGYLQSGGPTATALDDLACTAASALNRRTLHRLLSDLVNSHTLHPARLVNDLQKIARRLFDQLPPESDTVALSHLQANGLVARTEDETFLVLPGLRHALSEQELRRLLDDPVSAHLGAAERKIVRDTVLRKVDEQTLSDLLLLETIRQRANATTDVFRIRFPSGGFDIVIADREELTCELRNVRLAAERDDRQLSDLVDQRKLDTVEHRYGIIVSREVAYLGRNAWHPSGIAYRNAAALLRD